MPYKRRRINYNASERGERLLHRLSDLKGMPQGTVIENALEVYSWLIETRAQGNRILVELPGGGTRELISL